MYPFPNAEDLEAQATLYPAHMSIAEFAGKYLHPHLSATYTFYLASSAICQSKS